MNSSESAQSAQSRYYLYAITSLLAALGVYLVWVAIHLRIDFFDAYEALLNARKIATLDTATHYYWKRPFIFPILLSPIFVLERWILNPNFSFITAHISCVTIFFLLLFIFYKFLRLEFQKIAALVGTLAMAGNSLLIHFAPFAKEDIAATLLMSAAFYSYWAAKINGKTSSLFLTGFLITLAAGTRYNLIPVLFGILFIYEALERLLQINSSGATKKQKLIVKISALYLFPVVLYFLIITLLYTVLGLAPWQSSIQKFFQDFVSLYSLNADLENPNWNYIFLFKSIPTPLHIFLILGIFLSFKERRPISIFFAVWLFCFFIFQTYVIAVREARYLFPLFPPVYYFLLKGALFIFDKLLEKLTSSKYKTLATLIFCGGLIILPLREGFLECLKFKDPVYSYDFSVKISQAVKDKAGNSNIFWVGPFYTIYAKDFIFDLNDKVTYVYHFYRNALEFYAKKQTHHLPITGYLHALTNQKNEPLLLSPGSHQFLNKGDVVIINREPTLYVTNSLPRPMIPLLIEKVNEYQFNLIKSDNSGHSYVSPLLSDAQINSRLLPEGYLIEGSGIPNGRYELYVRLDSADHETAPFGFVAVANNSFSTINTELKKDLPIGEIILFFYDSVETFSLDDIYADSIKHS